ncbi:hypothetical protein A5724_19430 [Mycobacterium sp. ACS1612]|uniref:hypothetical protein n=1 Tax=Mycobacterium sp. ACS1612 TaxID=1834117 RepID=UPI0007FE4F57|nr:hypothetical protein [Mycobacterium sp. ACS1612]OBF33249.1 hypothetical protein A5724_19430 [Mycobacterium sp. ACS1612]
MPDPQHIDAADDPRLPALMAWRQRLIDAGAVSRTSFKEAHLRLVLRSGRTDVAQIRAMLPPSAAEHADEMARLLAELENRRGSVAVVTDNAPSTDALAEQIPYQTDDFAAFQLGEQRGDVHPIGLRRRRDEAQSGALELTWPPYPPAGDDTVVIYRIVSDEDDPPYSPDRAYLLGVTTATSALDERPPRGSVRHYQVWVNSGPTRAQALAAQPVKHAEAALVSPVRDFTIREDGGQVIGRWTVPSAVSDVFVYRIPAQETGREGLEHRILRGSDTRDGFVDTEALRGQRYLYRVRCAATIGGVIRLSEATEATVDVSAVLAPVTDLSLGAHSQDGTRFELTWTPPPTGTVVIYRSQTPPSAGAEAVELPEATLEQIGLHPVQRLTQPVSLRRDEHGHDNAVMSGVSWPDSWSRAYFTPVTVLTGRALLGTTVSSVRTGVIHDVNLAEYCNKQVLTFDWPAGAAAVVAHLAPKGHDPRKGLTGKSFEISLEEYEKYGGMQLSRQELPAAGCSLHLAPVAFSAGRRVVGAIRSVEYAGLLRLQYAVRIARDPDGWPGYATVALRSQYELPGSPAFVLIHNPQRIPLSMHDGQAVDAVPVNEHGQIVGEASKELRWSALTTHGTGEMWTANVHGLRGWIRLFVNTPSPARLRTIALLDPPVENLRLSAVAP